jgi:hypothetical protein
MGSKLPYCDLNMGLSHGYQKFHIDWTKWETIWDSCPNGSKMEKSHTVTKWEFPMKNNMGFSHGCPILIAIWEFPEILYGVKGGVL